MFKYSVLGFLPALFFSVSANALSCFQPSDTVSSDCYDKTKAAEDCKALGYEKVTTTDDNCHYLLCPFNTDYKVCINKDDNETTTPTCKDGGYSDTKNKFATCTEVSYKGLTCYECSFTIVEPTPNVYCENKAATIQDLAQIGTYLAECESSRYCYNKGASNKTYSAWYAKPMLAFLGLSDPQIFCGEANHATRGNKCQEAKTKLTELVNAHNTNCPNNKVTAPKIDCGQCFAMGACDNSGHTEFQYCVGIFADY